MTTTQRKRSFFERLTGSIRMEEDEAEVVIPRKKTSLYNQDDSSYYEEDEVTLSRPIAIGSDIPDDEPVEAQLAVDIYETNDAIVVKTMTAGVKKEDLAITITRESLVIRGKRENEARAYQNTYHVQELYWGGFSREITLPDEIDIDKAIAHEHHGLITIKLPKFDKARKTSLKIQ